MGGGGFSGAEFAPFPFPFLLPPAGMGRLFSGVSQSLCLFGFCLRSLPCLISALQRQAEVISYLGSLVQFSPAAGRAGALQTDIAVCGEHSPCSGHTGFAPHRGVCAFPVYTAQAPSCSIWSRPCVECSSSFRVLHKSADSVAPAFCAFPGLSGSGRERLGRTPFPSAAPARAACGLRLFRVGEDLASSRDPPAADVDHPESQEFFR